MFDKVVFAVLAFMLLWLFAWVAVVCHGCP